MEAKRLLAACCSTAIGGAYVAEELAEEQTLENLRAFSYRLAESRQRLQKGLPPLPAPRMHKLLEDLEREGKICAAPS